MNRLNYLFFSKNNLAIGEKLRKIIKKTGGEIYYFNNLSQTINFLTSTENNMVFIEKCFSKYIKILSELISADIFKNCAIVFIDNSEDVKKYLNGKNIFAVSESLLDNEVFDIINKFMFISENGFVFDMSHLKVLISKILIDIGISVKQIGFSYIKDCIEYVSKRNFKLGGLHADVYNYVACLNNTTISNVERSIRNCIYQAKKKNDNFLSDIMKNGNYEVTNKMFLGYIIEKVQENCANVG